MPRSSSPYSKHYERERAALLSTPRSCALRIVCDGARATSADHVPPLSLHTRPHVHGSGCCRLQPACRACQARQGLLLARGVIPRSKPVPSRVW